MIKQARRVTSTAANGGTITRTWKFSIVSISPTLRESKSQPRYEINRAGANGSIEAKNHAQLCQDVEDGRVRG
jgi:hypothetical protein